MLPMSRAAPVPQAVSEMLLECLCLSQTLPENPPAHHWHVLVLENCFSLPPRPWIASDAEMKETGERGDFLSAPLLRGHAVAKARP